MARRYDKKTVVILIFCGNGQNFPLSSAHPLSLTHMIRKSEECNIYWRFIAERPAVPETFALISIIPAHTGSPQHRYDLGSEVQDGDAVYQG